MRYRYRSIEAVTQTRVLPGASNFHCKAPVSGETARHSDVTSLASPRLIRQSVFFNHRLADLTRHPLISKELITMIFRLTGPCVHSYSVKMNGQS